MTQSFKLDNLSGEDIQAIMNGLNELPTKVARITMNKVEVQIIEQVKAQQEPQPRAMVKSEDSIRAPNNVE